MKYTKLLAAAALITAGLTAPALADWDNVGTINVSPGRDVDRQYGDFGGPVQRLMFRADRSDVSCRSIRVSYGNGRTREVFSGVLRENNTRIVDLPGEQRNIRRIDFLCSSASRRGAEIAIAADVGSYRDAWMRNPNWKRRWARAVDRNTEFWVPIGTERFTGRRDRETNFVGVRGRSVSAIGLKPLDNDAVCARVVARFANGTSRALNVDWGDRLREDRIYRVDLPGNQRNITQINMVCRAVGDRDVTIQVFAAK